MQVNIKSRRFVRGVCVLVIVIVGITLLMTTLRVQADDPQTCFQCDTSHDDRRQTCYTNYDACINDPSHTYTPTQCQQTLNQCVETEKTTYSNCLYGLPNGQFCTITYPVNTTNPYPCQHRTQCDTECRSIRADCLQNDGSTCGEDYNNCVVGCCDQ
jgi:hypothetical protein